MTIAFAALLACLAQAEHEMAGTPARPAAPSSKLFLKCPLGLEEWKKWRRESLLPALQDGYSLLKNNTPTFSTTLNSFLEKCEKDQADLFSTPDFGACLGKIRQIEKSAAAFIFPPREENYAFKERLDGFPPSYRKENIVAVEKAAKGNKEELKEAIASLTEGATRRTAVRFDSAILPGLKSLVILDERDQ
jgi:hypothetical protein